MGCALAAHRLGEARTAVEVASGLGGPPEALIVGAARVAAPNAALANGALMHALDFDDTHADALLHVTATVVPAALAVAEANRVSGSEFLTACVAGFEVVSRLGRVVRHGFHARGFHATSVCGVFAAALVTSKLEHLGEQETVDALGVAGSLAAGSLQFLLDGTSTKQLHPGLAAHGGVIAARLAAAGASGPERILEGENGLYRSYAEREVAPEELVSDLGAVWESSRITLKPYPACQLSHASLDALDAAGATAEEVRSVTFLVPRDSVPTVCEPLEAKRRPKTPYEAKFSLPWCAAVLLIDGTITIDSFEQPSLERPEVLELADRIGYQATDPGVAAAAAPGEARVVLRDGTELRGFVDTSRGAPSMPLNEEEVRQKFAINAGDINDQLVGSVLGLDAVEDISHLTALIEEASARPSTAASVPP
jgi:2-methylcitrate dehydratase PrpD